MGIQLYSIDKDNKICSDECSNLFQYVCSKLKRVDSIEEVDKICEELLKVEVYSFISDLDTTNNKQILDLSNRDSVDLYAFSTSLINVCLYMDDPTDLWQGYLDLFLAYGSYYFHVKAYNLDSKYPNIVKVYSNVLKYMKAMANKIVHLDITKFMSDLIQVSVRLCNTKDCPVIKEVEDYLNSIQVQCNEVWFKDKVQFQDKYIIAQSRGEYDGGSRLVSKSSKMGIFSIKSLAKYLADTGTLIAEYLFIDKKDLLRYKDKITEVSEGYYEVNKDIIKGCPSNSVSIDMFCDESDTGYHSMNSRSYSYDDLFWRNIFYEDIISLFKILKAYIIKTTLIPEPSVSWDKKDVFMKLYTDDILSIIKEIQLTKSNHISDIALSWLKSYHSGLLDSVNTNYISKDLYLFVEGIFFGKENIFNHEEDGIHTQLGTSSGEMPILWHLPNYFIDKKSYLIALGTIEHTFYELNKHKIHLEIKDLEESMFFKESNDSIYCIVCLLENPKFSEYFKKVLNSIATVHSFNDNYLNFLFLKRNLVSEKIIKDNRFLCYCIKK